ncbi:MULTISPECIES: RimK family alpha-L-glutamate ligase [Haloferax]|uniref:RimK family alpha-L-glutamate ligase n=1 Tax=Haloferax marinum TaxID=2666143 RepID=A0A6A8GAA7_9EURY|nr:MULTISPECIES: RimK family alpha-L-glutamate ligase [Haloferax]KAB1198421.1 RimK family alpha-L-glutamate ligase [Haloferax sp. CBA1150]MRW97522.1 RimK family alpha-L-glutamate ligase [Haloferax marinum]
MVGGEPTIKVGILGFHDSRETKALSNTISSLGHEAIWLHEEAVGIDVSTDGVVLEPDVDVVINRLLLSKSTAPFEDLSIASCFAAVCPVLNDPRSVLFSVHKHATACRLAAAGVPVPHTYMSTGDAKLNERRAGFGTPVVYKTAIGTNGGGTWLVDHDRQLSVSVDGRRAFIQEYLSEADEHRDLRVYIVDDEIVGAMYRYAPAGDWRTNVALGGEVEDATTDLSQQAAGAALRAVRALELDFAGVDLIESPDGWVVLEVNPTAGFRGLFRATGRSPAAAIARLAIERAGGSVDDALVDQLSRELDGTPPEDAPSTVRDDRVPVVGYTERVTVTGISGSKVVLAHIDTASDVTRIDPALAIEVGTEPPSVITDDVAPRVDVVVELAGDRRTVTAVLDDGVGGETPIRIGRDVLRNYYVDVRRRISETSEV